MCFCILRMQCLRQLLWPVTYWITYQVRIHLTKQIPVKCLVYILLILAAGRTRKTGVFKEILLMGTFSIKAVLE